MAVLELEKEGSVSVIKMNNGTNNLDLNFVYILNQVVGEASHDDTSHALVIVSTDKKNWCQGINLEWMRQESQKNIIEFFVQLDQVYSLLMLSPAPTIAAITGHAFGAGAFLATACDYRFMNAQNGFFCFPEIDFKLDIRPGAFSMLIHKLPNFKLPDLIYTGKKASARELEKSFIVEKACDGVEDTIKSAMKFAGSLNKDRKIMSAYKQKLNGKAAAALIEMDREYIKSMQ